MLAKCKTYFKYLYTKQRQYNRVTDKKYGFESAENVREKHIISEDSICDMFEELSNTSWVDH